MPSGSITLRLLPEVLSGLEKRARAESISLADLAERIITQALLQEGSTSGDLERADAELQLIAFVEHVVAAIRSVGWSEHVTLSVFEKIRREQFDLYRRATIGGHERRINREIGSLVRQRLGAEVQEVNGRRQIAQLGRNSDALIRTYTLLKPSTRKD